MKYQVEFKHKNKDFENVWNIEHEYLEPSTIATVKQTIEWDSKNPDIHIFVRDNDKNKIIGEITLLPLSKEQFDKFMLNELEDTEINKDTLLQYKAGEKYYLLFSAIAIDSKYREDKLVLSCLLKGLNRKIQNLMENDIEFSNMCAEGQTNDGQKFIESFLNMRHRNTTKDGYKLYSFHDAQELYDWIKKFPEYINVYDERYNLKDGQIDTIINKEKVRI